MAKRPAILFYTGDWIKDTALRCCSIGARGMWIDMICYMHDCTPYGHLKVKDKVILPANLASLVGLSKDETEGYLKELFEAGVCAQKEDGTIYSERMVKDEDVRVRRASGGFLGGNPALKKEIPPKKPRKKKGYPSLENVDVNENEDRDGKDGGAGEAEEGKPPDVIVMPFDSKEFTQAWGNWIDYKRDVKKFRFANAKTEQAALHGLIKLAEGVEENAIELIVYAIGRQWESFYNIPTNEKNNGNNRTTNRPAGESPNAAFERQLQQHLAANTSAP